MGGRALAARRHDTGGGPGHGRLHVARTGPRRGRRSAHRHLLVRRRSVRDAVRKRAFRGDSHVETMNAILKEDPPEFRSPNAIPPALERIVARCLEKQPAARFHSADDPAFRSRRCQHIRERPRHSQRVRGTGEAAPPCLDLGRRARCELSGPAVGSGLRALRTITGR